MSGFGEFAKGASASLEGWVQNKEFRYEASVVKLLLKRFNIQHRQRDPERACEESTGHQRLSLAWFYAAYPGFPIYLGARRIPDVSKMSLYDLHDSYERDGVTKDRFFTSPIYKAYESMEENLANVSAVLGLVFPCRKVVHYILHNAVDDYSFRRPGSRLYKTSAKGHTCVLEPLPQYLSQIAESWRPV